MGNVLTILYPYTALCGAGEYYSVTFGECRVCPANTVAGDSGLAVCPCAEEYYRADGEEDLPCTRELSLIRPLQIDFLFPVHS